MSIFDFVPSCLRKIFVRSASPPPSAIYRQVVKGPVCSNERRVYDYFSAMDALHTKNDPLTLTRAVTVLRKRVRDNSPIEVDVSTQVIDKFAKIFENRHDVPIEVRICLIKALAAIRFSRRDVDINARILPILTECLIDDEIAPIKLIAVNALKKTNSETTYQADTIKKSLKICALMCYRQMNQNDAFPATKEFTELLHKTKKVLSTYTKEVSTSNYIKPSTAL